MPIPHVRRFARHASIANSVTAWLKDLHPGLHAGDQEAQTTIDAFKELGGCIGADDLAARISATGRDGFGTVARWIVRRQVLVVHTAEGDWLPRCQFEQPAWTLVGSVPRVLRDLTPVMSDAGIAAWFCSPNEWIQGGSPAGALLTAPSDVWAAARAQRFLIVI